MRLNSLRLQRFRNYEGAELSFDPRLNLFIGNNGQGKSNLLEALYFAVTGRSFRTNSILDLIQHEKENLFLEISFSKSGIDQTLSIGLGRDERRVSLNGAPQPTFSSLLGLLRGVILSPEDRGLITGAPSLRRRFLDLHLAQLDPEYVQQMARYTRALRQRNALLKAGNLSTIDTWEEQMAAAAGPIVAMRHAMVEELGASTPDLLKELSGGAETLTLRYRSSCDGDFATALAEHRSRDQALGHTTLGPHRDNLSLLLNGREARLFGSEGQKASCGLALRLAEWKRLRRHSDDLPLLFLDDVANALDEHRKGALQELLQEVGQTFVASPHPLPLEGALFHIRGGICSREAQPTR